MSKKIVDLLIPVLVVGIMLYLGEYATAAAIASVVVSVEMGMYLFLRRRENDDR